MVLAWLLGLHATGAELVQERWRHGCAAVRALGGHSGGGPHLGLVNADLFELDLGPVDILFINSIVFNPAAQERLSARAARMLRPGARVVASSPLRGPRFEMLSEHVVPVTWAAQALWTVQRVLDLPASTEQPGERASSDERALGPHCFWEPQCSPLDEPT